MNLKNLQHSGDSESEVGRHSRSHDIFQKDSPRVLFTHDYETESALVQCYLDGCESFSDVREQQNT